MRSEVLALNFDWFLFLEREKKVEYLPSGNTATFFGRQFRTAASALHPSDSSIFLCPKK